MASIDNLLTAAALKYLNETAGKRSAEAIWRKAMIQYLGGGAGLGRLSLNALAARTARQVTGQPFSGMSLDGLLLRWAYALAPAGTPGGLSAVAVASRAANKYLTAPPAPTNTVAPAISGTPSVGQTLTTTNGTWTGSPTGYAYQWRRNGTAISGATANTYVVQAGDAGTTLTCTVTATNAGGSTAAVSNGSAIPAGPTYADYLTHINSRAINGGKSWTAFGTGVEGSYYVDTNTGSSGFSMLGQPWGGTFPINNASIEILLGICFPSAAEAASQRSAGRRVFFRAVDLGTTKTEWPGQSRNGFGTSPGSVELSEGYMAELIYWTPSGVFKMTPNLAQGPVPYTW